MGKLGGIRIEMDYFNFVVVKESAEEIAGREAESALKKEENTIISFILGVGMSSLAARCHCSMARSGTKWFATSLQISFSSVMDG
jgi:hypothetical protein